MGQNKKYSPSGGPIFHHTKPAKNTPAVEKHFNSQQILEHVENHFGPIKDIFYEFISEEFTVDILCIPADKDRPYHTIVTLGLSSIAMNIPEKLSSFRYAELLIYLPQDWPLDIQVWEKDDSYYWPIRTLKRLSNIPYKFDSWIWMGHTIPNGEPPTHFAQNTQLCCSLLCSLGDLGVFNKHAKKFSTDTNLIEQNDYQWVEAARELKINEEKSVHFWMVVPIYEEEMNFKLSQGYDALIDELIDCGISPILDIKRPNAAKK